MHTKRPGILKTWRLPLDENHYMQVIIWEDEDSMHQAFEMAYPNCLEHDFYGYCMVPVWVENNKTLERKAPAKFGDIHLVIGRMGAGYVAHELLHVVHYWQDFKNWEILKDDETIAYLMSDMTNNFWTSFYRNFERTPGS